MGDYMGFTYEQLAADHARLAQELREARGCAALLSNDMDAQSSSFGHELDVLRWELEATKRIADARGPHDTYAPELVRQLCNVALEGDELTNEVRLPELARMVLASAEVQQSLVEEKLKAIPEDA